MRNRTHNKVWRRYEGKWNQVDNESKPYYVKVIATYTDELIAYAVVHDTDERGVFQNVIAKYSYTDDGKTMAHDHVKRLNRTQ